MLPRKLTVTLEKMVSRVRELERGLPPSKLRKCGLCGLNGCVWVTEKAL
jgi:hypothetical protein